MILRKIKYTAFLVFLVLLVATLYLSLIGLPETAARRIEKRLQFSGLVITLEKVKLGIFEGIIGTRVRCYRKGDIGAPLLEAEKIILRFQPAAWLRGRSGLSGALIKNGFAALPGAAGPAKAGAPAAERFVIQVPFARLAWDEARQDFSGSPGVARLQVRECRVQAPGLNFSGRGELVLPREEPTSGLGRTAGAAEDEIVSLATPQRALSLHRAIATWERCRRSLSPSDDINVDVAFFLDSADLSSLDAQMRADARHTRFSQTVLGAWGLTLNIKGLSAEGTLDLKDAVIEGAPLSALNSRVQINEQGLVVQSLEATVGKEPGRGSLKLSGNGDWRTRQYQGAFVSAFDPNALRPPLAKLDKTMASVLTWFQFPDQPPTAKADFNGRWGTNAFFYLSGQAQADNCRYNTVSNLFMKLGLAVELSATNSALTLAPLLVVREEGTVQGQARLDFREETIRFDGLSTADPQAVARMLDPFFANVVGLFRFEGPVKVAARGTAGYMAMATNDLDIEIDAQRSGWKALLLDRCTLNVRIVADTAYINDVEADFCRGRISGSGMIYPVLNATNMRYQFAAEVGDVDCKALARDMLGLPAEQHRGTLAGALELEGALGAGAGQSAMGHGWIKIDGSRLFQIPLFGGLSEFLGRIVPGLNLFMRLTDARASFVIADGKLRSDDIVIAGEVITLTGKGDYHWNGELDFAVQVKLLKKDSLLGGVVQTALAPLTKMLEFRLTGTLADPHWRPAYLPKEMFFIFD
ncbi:MAG: hypothetical protein HYV35_08025 [Lentisphaerae bacterium]|nr:hypothetical protein [Lentisphaerota bacterium]